MATRKKREVPEDLAELDSAVAAQEEGILVPIMNMDRKSPLGFSIRVAGPDSERAQEARALLQQYLIDRGSLDSLTPRERTEQEILMVARLTLGWDRPIKMDGILYEYSEENAVKLFTRFKFIYHQVNEAAGQRERFLEESEKASSEQSEAE